MYFFQTEAMENIQQIFPSLESLSIIQDSVSKNLQWRRKMF